jgi:hypothetical protein
MSRYKAALIHLGISVAIGLATFLFMLTVWYPGPFFKAVGGGGLVLILLGVDVTIGPLITLVVFNTAKKSLKMDMTVVALMQLAAFSYGVWTIFEARPAYVAFTIDRFDLVRVADLDPDDVKAAKLEQFRSLPLLRPQVIAVRRPTESGEKTKALDLALAGKDIHLRPEYYEPYEAQKDVAKQKLLPMKRLKELNAAASADIDREIQATGKKEDQIGYLPLRAREKDLAVIVDRATGDIIGYWSYSPWGDANAVSGG